MYSPHGRDPGLRPDGQEQPAPPAAPAASAPGQASPSSIRASLATLYEANGSPLAWAPDGKTIYIGGSLTLFDVAARKATPIQGVTTCDLSVSPDGKLLALAIYDGAQIWDAPEPQHAAPAGRQRRLGSGGVLAGWHAAGHSGWRRAQVWEVATGTRCAPSRSAVRSRPWPSRPTGGPWRRAERASLALGCDDRAAERPLKGHSNWVRGLAFSADGRLLASSSVDQSARLWNIETGQQARVFTGHTGEVSGVSLSPDGRLLATASWDLTVRLWDAATGAELQSLTGHTSWIQGVAFSPDGSLLASGASDGLRLWRIEAGGAPQPAARPPAAGPLITPLPVAQSAITPGNIAQLKQLPSLKSDRDGRVIWSPDGKLLAVAAYRMTIHDARTLKLLYTMDGQQTGSSNAFSPDAALLASAAYEGVKVWDTTGWGELRTLDGSKDTHSLAFRPDGKLLATGTGSTVKLWEVASGKEIRTLPEPPRRRASRGFLTRRQDAGRGGRRDRAV